jgi:PAS domain S-box-containing protein
VEISSSKYNSQSSVLEQNETEVLCKKAQCDALNILYERLKVVQDFTHSGFWVFDYRARDFFWTDEMYRICGYQPQEIIPKANDFLDLVYKEDKELVVNYFKGANENISALEFRIIKPDNSIVWVQTKMVCELNKQVEVVRRYGVVQDITKRKLSERKLQESETKFREIAENLGEVICVLQDNQVVFVNQAYEKVWGRTSQSLYDNPNSFLEAIHPDDRELTMKIFAKEIQSSKEFIEAQYRIRTPDGTIKFIWSKQYMICDNRGNMLRAIRISEDITTLKTTELEYRRSESNLNKAQQIAHLGSWSWDLLKNEILWSDSMYQIFAIDKKNMTGRLGDAITKVIHPEDLHLVKPSNATSFAGNKPVEYRIIWPDGSIHYIWAKSGEPIYDEGGNLVYLTGIAQDITERKLIQNAMKEFELANSAKSAFLANMSHEIRTPINAIIGFNYLIQKTHLTNSQSDYVEKTLLSAQHLLGVITNILDLSKIEANKIDIEATEFDLFEVLYNVSNIVSLSLYEKNLKFHFNIDPNIPQFIIGDALRFNQVLLNLINNAIKFTLEGEITVSIVLDSKQDNHTTLRFIIEDTGIGISEEQQTKLFHAFSQIDSSSTRKHGGTGLGLAISKRFIELMGGSIYAKSELGKGSQFIFTVQFLIDEDHKVDPKEINLSTLTLLLISENKDMITIINTQLEQFEIKIIVVESVLEAINELRAVSDIDLVYIDWKLANMECLQAAKLIKSDLNDSTPPLIVVSAYREDKLENFDDVRPCEGVFYFPMGEGQIRDKLSHMFRHRLMEEASTKVPTPRYKVNSLGNVKILLVEDNELNQELTKAILENFGFETDIASNGRESIDMAIKQSYDLILMDLLMPEMDGYEATRRIRANGSINQIPIIAMSAHVMKGIKDTVLEAGMNDYISKPFHVPDMMETITKWIRLYRK